jgi:hypothetical protein
MEIRTMSAKPDFTTMTFSELRAYVLDHRDDQDALQVFLDKCQSSQAGSRKYGVDEDVSEAIDQYLTERRSP